MPDYNFDVYFRGLNELMQVYGELDEAVKAFINDGNPYCPAGCIKCCLNPGKNIEATVFELLPLGIHTWRNNIAGNVLEAVKSAGEEGLCAIFNINPEKNSGGCLYYDFRPLVCRLFGAYSYTDKYGFQKKNICRYKKRGDKFDEDHCILPVNTVFRDKIKSLDPYLTKDLLPINKAIALAVEKAGWYFL